MIASLSTHVLTVITKNGYNEQLWLVPSMLVITEFEFIVEFCQSGQWFSTGGSEALTFGSPKPVF